MTKKQVTPKSRGPKPQKKASAKIPQLEPSKIDKPTPALTAESTEVFQTFCPTQVDIPKLNPPFDTFDFPSETRQIVSILSVILEYNSDEFTDVAILGFMSTLSPG